MARLSWLTYVILPILRFFVGIKSTDLVIFENGDTVLYNRYFWPNSFYLNGIVYLLANATPTPLAVDTHRFILCIRSVFSYISRASMIVPCLLLCARHVFPNIPQVHLCLHKRQGSLSFKRTDSIPYRYVCISHLRSHFFWWWTRGLILYLGCCE